MNPSQNPNEAKGSRTILQGDVTRYFHVLSGDLVLEWDGFFKPAENGTPAHWYLIIQCPKCLQPLTIDGTKKRIGVDDRGLSIERFRCVNKAQFGGQCPWAGEVEPPVKKEDRMAHLKGVGENEPRMVTIDGIVKDARRG